MEQWGPLGIWGSGHSLSHYAKAQIPQIQLELRDKLFQHQESESEAKICVQVGVRQLMETICGIFVFKYLTPACFQCPVSSHASCIALQYPVATILVPM